MHTKGPWEIYSWDANALENLSIRKGSIHICDLGLKVNKINQANARLIAATPEMYEFINEIANLFSWHESTLESFIDDAKEIVRKAKEG